MTAKQEIIVYPNNTFCIDGKYCGRDAALLQSLGVPAERQRDLSYTTPVATIIAFGKCPPSVHYPITTVTKELNSV